MADGLQIDCRLVSASDKCGDAATTVLAGEAIARSFMEFTSSHRRDARLFVVVDPGYLSQCTSAV